MKGDGAPIQPFRPLSTRLVFWVLLYSAAFTVVMTIALTGLHYLDERDDAVEQLQFAATSYRKSISTSLWELDMPAVRLQLDGLANFPMVGRAEIVTSIGQRIVASKYGTSEAEAKMDGQPSMREKLVSPEHPDFVVGELRLYVDRRALMRRVEADALRILGGEAIKGLLFGMLLAWLTTQLVTRHVTQIARRVATLEPDALDQPLVLDRRRPPHRDELDQLTDAINRVHQRLHQYIVMQKSLESQLREHRDGLAHMVADRTRSLERLREFHGMIITLLTRFINLPPEQADVAIEHGLAAFGSYFDAKRCLLLMHDEADGCYRIANTWPPLGETGNSTTAPPFHVTEADLPPSPIPVLHAQTWLSIRDAIDNTMPETHHRLLALLGCHACTIVSIEVKGNTVGLLCLVGTAVPSDSPDAKQLQLAAQVAANMLDHNAAQRSLLEAQQALQQANGELLALSRRDPLTGLGNRRLFEEVKDIEFRRAVRAGSQLSVLMCDIDDFKRYNDTYGHAHGDDCLVNISRCLSELFGRAGELPVRLGGEEFAVLLPNVGYENACRLAEGLRRTVWELALPHEASRVADRVTISIGVASLKHGVHRDFDQLLRDADEALYRAKETRNRVVAA